MSKNKVTCDLEGFEAKNIKIAYDGSYIIVEAKKKQGLMSGTYYKKSIYVGDIDVKDIKTDFDGKTLTIITPVTKFVTTGTVNPNESMTITKSKITDYPSPFMSEAFDRMFDEKFNKMTAEMFRFDPVFENMSGEKNKTKKLRKFI